MTGNPYGDYVRRLHPDVLTQQSPQVVPIGIAGHDRSELLDSGGVDVPHPIRYLFHGADLESLTLFDRRDVGCGLQQRLRRTGIEPGDAASQSDDLQVVALEVRAIDVGDLQLATPRGPQPLCDVEHTVVVEVEPGHGVM